MEPSSSNNTTINKVAAASFIGTAIEWYDFFIFNAAVVLVFPTLFFPGDDPLLGALKASGIFAVGFISRPIGGIVCGHFGDRIGRKHMLVMTLLITGISTLFIGLLPAHKDSGSILSTEYFGVWVPILLILLRFAQGFGIGGEWGGAVLLAIEHSPKGKRGFYGSWPQVGVPIGLLSYALFSLSKPFGYSLLPDWWRLPFLLSILLVGVGLYIRLSVPDSPLLSALEPTEKARVPVLEALRRHPKAAILATGARLAENLSFYLYTTFLLILAVKYLKYDQVWVLNAVSLAALLMIAAIPFYGWLSDLKGRRPIYLLGSVFTGLFAFPFFWLVETRSNPLMVLAVVLALVIGWAMMYAPQGSFFPELFGTGVRYSGASFATQVATIFSGGLAPLIAESIMNWAGGTWPVAVYLLLMAAVTTVSVFLAPETHRHDISGGSRGSSTDVKFGNNLLAKPKYEQEEIRKQRVTAESKRRYIVALIFACIFIGSTTILLGGVSGVFPSTSDTSTWVTLFIAVVSAISAVSTTILAWKKDRRDAREQELKIAQLERELEAARECSVLPASKENRK
jgi:MFS family permease